jgi:hypothetical protein
MMTLAERQSRVWSANANKTALVAGAVLFLVLLTTYVMSPVRTSSDSRWSIPTALSLARGEGGDLTAYMPPSPSYASQSYALAKIGAHTYSVYPIGASLLALPAVAVTSLTNPRFAASIRQTAPEQFEKTIASFYGAVACALLFWVIFDRFKDLRIAIATTLIFGLGTSMWSTSTRALWQHGPLILMLIAAMLLLLKAQRKPALVQYVGIPLALSMIMRSTAALPIAVISVYVLVCYRAWFVRFMLWAAVIAIPWMIYNTLIWGAVLPPYYLNLAARGIAGNFADALLGNLISPARGLFVFSPVLILALSGFVLAIRTREERALNISFGLIVVLHWIMVSHFSPWWGGHSFGPRLMSDVLPFLAYFLAFSLQWCLSAFSWQRITGTVVIAGLAGISIFIHAQGALRWEPHQWNVSPADIDLQPGRLWDWNDPPFLR